jgi:hypothetical protein
MIAAMKLKKTRVKRGSWYTVSIPFTPHDRVVVGEAIQESGMGVGEFFRAAALTYGEANRRRK